MHTTDTKQGEQPRPRTYIPSDTNESIHKYLYLRLCTLYSAHDGNAYARAADDVEPTDADNKRRWKKKPNCQAKNSENIIIMINRIRSAVGLPADDGKLFECQNGVKTKPGI